MALDVTYNSTNIIHHTQGSGDKSWRMLTKDQLLADNVLLQYTELPINETTATASDVNLGKYFFDAAGVKQAGTQPIIWTKVHEEDVTVNTSSTSATLVRNIYPSGIWSSDFMVYVKIRDKAGPRNGYFVGSDTWFLNPNPANGSGTNIGQAAKLITSKASGGNFSENAQGTTVGYGVFASYMSNAPAIDIYSRYSSSYSLTINGTYNVQVYKLAYATDQGSPFDYSFS